MKNGFGKYKSKLITPNAIRLFFIMHLADQVKSIQKKAKAKAAKISKAFEKTRYIYKTEMLKYCIYKKLCGIRQFRYTENITKKSLYVRNKNFIWPQILWLTLPKVNTKQ